MERGEECGLERLVFEEGARKGSITKKVGKACFYYAVLQLPFIGDKMVRDYVRMKKKNGVSPLARMGMNIGEPVFYVWKYGAYGVLIYSIGKQIF